MTPREKEIIGLVRKEVKPALGCTEPIAVALAASKAVEILIEQCPSCRRGRWRQTTDFMGYLENLIGFLLPLYVSEGKAALVIAIGCTGGQHRSVAITHALAEFIKQKGYQATENHRDMTRA